MSILRIPSLKKIYGTMDFAIDRTTGQLYKMGDLDVTPINLLEEYLTKTCMNKLQNP